MNDLVPTQPPETLLAVVMRAATSPDVDIGKMERLLDLRERLEAKQAETQFAEAMNDAQAEVTRVSADAVNPQTRSAYATYGQLDKALRPVYTKHGFSLSFDTEESPKADHVRVLCYVSHRAGHTRTYRADVPADGKGAKGNDVMTKTHAFGSGTSYGMRYLLKMIFNVAIGDSDDDGNGGEADGKAVEMLKRLMEHNRAVRDWMPHILDMIEHLREAEPDLEKVAEVWRGIPQGAQMALWVAPTKGGIFTTEERRIIKEDLPKEEA